MTYCFMNACRSSMSNLFVSLISFFIRIVGFTQLKKYLQVKNGIREREGEKKKQLDLELTTQLTN